MRPSFNWSNFFFFFWQTKGAVEAVEEALTAWSRVLGLFLLCSKMKQTAGEFLFWKGYFSFAPSGWKHNMSSSGI